MNLEGKNAIVTGGSLGIGTSIALVLAKAGANVAINYRKHADEANAVVAEIDVGKRRQAHGSAPEKLLCRVEPTVMAPGADDSHADARRRVTALSESDSVGGVVAHREHGRNALARADAARAWEAEGRGEIVDDIQPVYAHPDWRGAPAGG